MSRKTKQEKLVAELRRKLNSLETDTTEEKKDIVSSKALPINTIEKGGLNYSYSADRVARTAQVKTLNTQTSDYSYVFHDLKKILFLTGIAILSQFVLYFILNGQGITFLSRFR